jgi:hypothetical protein
MTAATKACDFTPILIAIFRPGLCDSVIKINDKLSKEWFSYFGSYAII